MKRFISVFILIVVITSTILLTSCEAGNFILKLLGLIGDDNRDYDFNFYFSCQHDAETIPAIESTCTTHGYTEGKRCTKCGMIIVQPVELPRKPHDEIIISGYPSTCNKQGLTDGKKCASCNTVIAVQTAIPQEQHIEVTVHGYPSTCTKEGLTDGKQCSVCKTWITNQSVIPKAMHNETIVSGYEATCNKTGLTDGIKCTVCDLWIKEQSTIPEKGHNATVVKGTDSTCIKEGITDGEKCSVCDIWIKEQAEIPLKAHTYDNKSDLICNVCGYKRTCSHDSTEVIKGYAATCVKEGLTDGLKCMICKEILKSQNVIPVIPHMDIVIPRVEPTCTKTGLTEGIICSVCRYVIKSQIVIPQKDHTWIIDPKVESTCTKTGLTEGKHCSACGYENPTQEIIPLKDHTVVVDLRVEPTCTKTGLTEGSHCSVCGYIIKAQEVLPLKDHVESDWIIDKDSTTSETGHRHTECITCKKLFKEETIPMRTHSEGLEYQLNPDGNSYSLSGIGTCTDTFIIIPRTYKELPVTAIASDSFNGNKSIIRVQISEDVESIGDRAFAYCSSLTEINIVTKVKSIGANTFEGCDNLAVSAVVTNADSLQLVLQINAKSIKIALTSNFLKGTIEGLSIPDTANYFELNGNDITLENFYIISNAAETVISNITLNNTKGGTGIQLSSRNVMLGNLTLTMDNQAANALELLADTVDLKIKGNVTLSSIIGGSGLIAKDISICADTVATLTINGGKGANGANGSNASGDGENGTDGKAGSVGFAGFIANNITANNITITVKGGTGGNGGYGGSCNPNLSITGDKEYAGDGGKGGNGGVAVNAISIKVNGGSFSAEGGNGGDGGARGGYRGDYNNKYGVRGKYGEGGEGGTAVNSDCVIVDDYSALIQTKGNDGNTSTDTNGK